MPKSRTKIIATLGPATDSISQIRALHKAGMRIARLNFSHGDHEYFKKLISNIRKVSGEIAILVDTKGPEIRTGVINEPLLLKRGQEVLLTQKKSKEGSIQINYKYIADVAKGSVILLNDGLIELKVISSGKAKVIRGGLLTSKRKVTIRNHDVKIPFLSSVDKKDILFAKEHEVDFIALSFVRTKNNVAQVRKLLPSSKIHLISKIEHPDAVKNFDAVLSVSDGIMVARGDLGVEYSLEKIPRVQEQILNHCNHDGKPVIIATQMLESMIEKSSPTRAEVGDVATAVLQGADAVMLSGETSIGKYPIKAVSTMKSIIKEYGTSVDAPIDIDEHLSRSDYDISKTITHAAMTVSQDISIAAIITDTHSGLSARLMSRLKPKSPIIAFTHDMRIFRQLQLSWGVIPRYELAHVGDLSILQRKIIMSSLAEHLISKKDTIVFIAGHHKLGVPYTNVLEIILVKDIVDKN